MASATLFFASTAAGGRLWITDGSRDGTRILEGPGYGDGFASFGDGRVLFSSDGLWVTDGTQDGSYRFSDLRFDTLQYGDPGRLPDGRLVFITQQAGENGVSIWVTDGTTLGTTRVFSFPNRFSNGPYETFTPLPDGSLLFRGMSAGGDLEPWVTDGTAAGTFRLADINPQGDSIGNFSGSYNPARLGDGRIVFEANDGTTGEELWITDGTEAGTRLLKDIASPTAVYDGSYPGGFVPLPNGNLLFTANGDDGRRDLWVTDGTSAGTVEVGETLFPEPFFDVIGTLGDGRIAFAVYGNFGDREIWTTDGTQAGTGFVYRFVDSAQLSTPGYGVTLGDGRLAFFFDDGIIGEELWVTDGTAAGTGLVRDINPGPGDYTGIFGDPNVPVALPDGRFIFVADDGVSGLEPWISDGTAAGTVLLKNLYPGSDRFGPNRSRPDEFFVSDFPEPTGNSTPVLVTPIGPQIAREDARFVFAVPAGTFRDDDAGDTLAFSASSATYGQLPFWLSFDPATRTFSGTPGNFDVGTDAIRVFAIDPEGKAVSTVFDLTVADANSPPIVVTEPRDRTLGVNRDLSLRIDTLFRDEDVGDTLALTFTTNGTSGLPDWLSLSATGGTLFGHPGYDDIGNTTLVMTATDRAGASASIEIVLSVVDLGVGTPAAQTLFGSNYDDVIEAGAGNDFIDGFGGNDRLLGQPGDDTISAFGSGDLRGGLGNDVLFGGGSNLIRGGRGRDTLSGADFGRQTLNGGSGNDVFLINSPEEGRDVIHNFVPGKDTFLLAVNPFAIGYLGNLRARSFEVAEDGIATRANTSIIYDATSGRLYADRDGAGGIEQPVWFLTLGGAPDISHRDFVSDFI